MTKEREEEIAESLKTALYEKPENNAYAKRLRNQEVAHLMEYKNSFGKGFSIMDFSPIYKILDKIAWFHLFPFNERQKLVHAAEIRIVEPDTEIFQQGEPSPCVHIINFGSVRASQSKSEWGPNGKIVLSTYFDG